MSELTTFGETMLRFSPPEDERLETAQSLDFRTAGAESNVAIAAARLETPTTWVSKLPRSPLGRRVIHDLHRHGVRTNISWSSTRRQGTYYIESGGRPRGTDVIYDRKESAVTTLTPDEVPDELVRDGEILFTTGITPALSQTLASTTEAVLRDATENDVTVAFDLNYRSKLWTPDQARTQMESIFPLVDVLFIAERDAQSVLGYDTSPEDTASRLAGDYDVGTVVVTTGERGALCYHDGQIYSQEAFEADTVDPIGTGDAFVGGFLSARIGGEPVDTALTVGAATAAIKRTIPGDLAVTTPQEVERVIEEGSATISR